MKDLKLKNDTDIEVEYILKQKEEELAKLGTKQDEQLNKLTEKVLVKQGESLLCMFSKLLSANSCTHSDLEEVMTKLDELAKKKNHPNAKVCLKGLEELGCKK